MAEWLADQNYSESAATTHPRDEWPKHKHVFTPLYVLCTADIVKQEIQWSVGVSAVFYMLSVF